VTAFKVGSGMRARIIRLVGVIAAGAVFLAANFLPDSLFGHAFAQEIAYFRIGAGAPGSTLYELAGRIASAISNPPGSRQCDNGGPCGVEGLIGLAQTTTSPVDALQSVEDGLMESAIVSADVAAEAAEGTGAFKQTGALTKLRAMANVGQLMLHVVVAREARFQDLAALAGKRIAIGAEDSDNAATARFLLRAAGVNDKKAKLVTGDPEAAAQELLDDKIDALVVVAQLPSADVAALMRTGNYRLLPVQLSDENKSDYVVADWIPHKQYPGAVTTPTLSVPAVWVVSSSLSDKLANGLAKALWQSAMDGEKPAANGKIHIDLDRLSLPLHPGAKAAFAEFGKTDGADAPAAKTPTTTN
jgi:uncharacterized protein